MYLFIDTSNNERIAIRIFFYNKKDLSYVKKIFGDNLASNLLKQIHKVFSKNSLSVKDVKGIAVVSGPGGFSSLRAGIVCANTLSWALRIPVVGLKKDETGAGKMKNILFRELGKKRKFSFVEPMYGKEPNITKTRKK